MSDADRERKILEERCLLLQRQLEQCNRYIAPGTLVKLKTGLEAWVNCIQIGGTILYEIMWQDGNTLERGWVPPWMIEELGENNERSMHLFIVSGSK